MQSKSFAALPPTETCLPASLALSNRREGGASYITRFKKTETRIENILRINWEIHHPSEAYWRKRDSEARLTQRALVKSVT
jgi:hypothetical protein